jgi:DNA polymerase-1
VGELLVGIDTETKGLGGTIHRVGMLTSDSRWFWLSLEEARSNTEWLEIIDDADAILAHNVRYDARVMRRDLEFCFPWDKTHDTMVVAAMNINGSEPKDLLSLSMKYLGYDGKADIDVDEYKEAHGIVSDYSKIPDSVQEPYTQQQLLNTMSLWVYWRKRLPESYWDFEQQLTPAMMRMEDRGVPLDTRVLRESKVKLQARIEDLKSEIFELADQWNVSLPLEYDGLFGVDFNLSSGKQLAEVITCLGYELPTTKSGNLKTDERTLKKVCGDDPFVGKLFELREATKLQSTYIENLLECVDDDDILRPSFFSTRTRTGRLSSSNPNAQNISSHSESAKMVREAFVSRSGFTTYTLDYSQIELRASAFLSEDPVAIDEYKRGIDFHTATAASVLNKHPDDVTKEERQKGKTINFATVYGAGAKRIARQLGVSDRVGERIVNRYSNHYQHMWTFKDKLVYKARQRGYVELPWGRKLRIDEQYAYKAFNYFIQGACADIIKKAMVVVDEFLSDYLSNLLLQIHDELDIEEHYSEPELVYEVKGLMEGVTDLCPLDVDIERWEGSWANKVELPPF